MTSYQQEKDQWNLTGTLTATSHGKCAKNHERKKLLTAVKGCTITSWSQSIWLRRMTPLRALMWIYVDFKNSK